MEWIGNWYLLYRTTWGIRVRAVLGDLRGAVPGLER